MALPRQDEVTPVQAEALRFLLGTTLARGHQPSKSEMAAHFGVYMRAVSDTLAQLERKGLVRLPPAHHERAVGLPWARLRAARADPAPRPALTPGERGAFAFVLSYLARYCYQPSRDELQEGLGVGTHQELAELLAGLQAKGYIRLPDDRAERALELPGLRFELDDCPEAVEQNAAESTLA